MNRFHVPVHGADLGQRIGLPSTRFGAAVLDEGTTTCRDARSARPGVTGPAGIAREPFRTLQSIPVFRATAPQAASGCC